MSTVWPVRFGVPSRQSYCNHWCSDDSLRKHIRLLLLKWNDMFQHRIFQLWIYDISANNLSFQLHNLFRRSLLRADHSCGRRSSNKGFRPATTIRRVLTYTTQTQCPQHEQSLHAEVTPIFLWLLPCVNTGSFNSVYLTCRSCRPRGVECGGAAAACWNCGFETRRGMNNCLFWVLCVVR